MCNCEDIDSLCSDFVDFDLDFSDVVCFDEEGNVSFDGGCLIVFVEGDLSVGSCEVVMGG